MYDKIPLCPFCRQDRPGCGRLVIRGWWFRGIDKRGQWHCGIVSLMKTCRLQALARCEDMGEEFVALFTMLMLCLTLEAVRPIHAV
jgi:hypothetical protein